MDRFGGLLLLAATAAVMVFLFARGEQEFEGPRFDDERVLFVERVLRSDGPEAARAALAERRADVSDPAAGYLNSAILFAEGRLDESLAAVQAARRHFEKAWRPLSMEYAVRAAKGDAEGTDRLTEMAVAALRYDERVLVLRATDLLNRADPQPQAASELLDRVVAMSERVAKRGDPTAVDESALFELRYRAAALSSRRRQALEIARAAVGDSPRDAGFHAMLGDAARMTGRVGEALEAYTNSCRLNPGRRDTAEARLRLLIDAGGDPGELLRASEDLVVSWPNEPSVQILRARSLVRAKQFDHAAEVYEELLEAHPTHRAALRNLGVLYYDWKQGGQDGRYLDSAYELLRRYRSAGGEIDGRLADPWNRLVARALNASADAGDRGAIAAAWEADRTSIEAGVRYVDALRTWSQAERMQAPFPAPTQESELRAWRARRTAADAHLGTAGEVVRELLGAHPRDARVLAFAMDHFAGGGPDRDPATVLALAERAVELTGLDAAPTGMLSRYVIALIAMGFDEKAYEVAHLLLGREQTADSLHVVARAAAVTGRLPEAERAYRDSLARDPDRSDRRAELLLLLLEAVYDDGATADVVGRRDTTRELVSSEAVRYIADDGTPRELVVVRAAALYREAPFDSDSIERFEFLFASDPTDPVTTRYLLEGLLDGGQARLAAERARTFKEYGGVVTRALAPVYARATGAGGDDDG